MLDVTSRALWRPAFGAWCVDAAWPIAPPVRETHSRLLQRIDGRAHGVHHLWCAYYFGVGAMIKNLVAGFVVAALAFMVLLAYTQEHHECLHGHLIKTLKPCGSLSSSM